MEEPLTVQDHPLWRKLKEFSFDPPTARGAFLARLAKENRWSLEHAERVLEEYRRFLFLGQVAGHPVSPSEAVDQAWHLHLAFTRSYWDELCARVLETPFHHEPSLGRPGEGAKMRDWYSKTRSSYAKWFGSPPPADLWPSLHERFAEAGDQVWVRKSRFWIVPKPTWGSVARRAAVAPVALLASGCAAQVLLNLGGPWDWRGADFLLLYGSLFLVAVFLTWVCRRIARLPSDELTEFDTPLDPLEVALAAGGRSRVVESAVASLLLEGAIEVEPKPKKGLKIVGPLRPDAHPVQRAVYDTISQRGSTDYAALCRSPLLNDSLQRLRERTDELGLTVPRHRSRYVQLGTSVFFWLLVAFAASKIYVGHLRHRPTEFLTVAAVLTALTGVVTMILPLATTIRGRALLRTLRKSNAAIKEELQRDAIPAGAAMLAVALFSPAILKDSRLASLPEQFIPWNSQGTSSTGGCGSGCSGGGGGCGGGGCGGCGGGD